MATPEEFQNQATKREMYQISLPLAIAKSLLAISSKDAYRPTLEKAVGVFNDGDKTVLVATDTHTMLVATAPNKIDIPTGNYRHEVNPAQFNGRGRMLLSDIGQSFPDYTKATVKTEPRCQVGTLDTNTGRLQSCESICLDYRRFAPLCPGLYQMFTPKDKDPVDAQLPYIFTAKYDDWSLTYLIMPMTRTDL